MTVRHSLLVAGAVLVLGMALYLVREVSRAPSPAQADHASPSSPSSLPPREVPPPRPPESATPTPARVAASRQPERPSPNPDRGAPIEHAQPPERVMPTGPNPKLDAVMAEANRAYDLGEFDEAKQIAQKVLERSPGNVRMLRIIVSSECIAGDSAEAQKYFVQLPDSDRAQMRTRCDRYGVTFKDP